MTIMNDSATEGREYRPLGNIKDNCPKLVITRNDLIQSIVRESITELIGKWRASSVCSFAKGVRLRARA